MADSWEEILNKLAKSRFRARQKLTARDRQYLLDKDEDTIREHARDFILFRLAPASPKNDGKQTPFRGHPVFTAQHATATCCRKCLAKWHRIGKNRQLSKEEVDYIAEVIMKWLKKQIDNS